MTTEAALHLAETSAFLIRMRPVKLPHVVARDAGSIHKLAASLHLAYEKNCNGEYASEGRYLGFTLRLEKALAAVLEPYGLAAYHQGDPRGWPVWLGTPAQVEAWGTNHRYHDGHGIPPR